MNVNAISITFRIIKRFKVLLILYLLSFKFSIFVPESMAEERIRNEFLKTAIWLTEMTASINQINEA